VRTAAIVRILTGLLFVAEGYSKLAGEFVSGGFGKDAVRMSHAAWPVWARFLQSTVIPNAATLAWVFALGELAVGIGLALGLWTRVACAGGLALMASILMAQTRPDSVARWDAWITAGLTPKLAFLLLLLLWATDAGKVWGLDGLAARRRRPKAARSKRRDSLGGSTTGGPSYL
jgi:uncharacterized membrane protein YphA (DoxX/SURF4 family)